MKFNELAGSIASSVNPIKEMGARGRAPNPEIEKLVKGGMPYWKARSMVRKGLAGNIAPSADANKDVVDDPVAGAQPAVTDTEIGGHGHHSSAEEQKTQAAVQEFMQSNPHATVEDVVGHLDALNKGPNALHTGYVVDPEEVQKFMSVDAEPVVAPTDGPVGADLEGDKAAKFARLRKFMSLPRSKRDEYLAKAKGDVDSTPDTFNARATKTDDGDEPEDSEAPWVHHYVKAMKPGHEDDAEEDEVIPDDEK